MLDPFDFLQVVHTLFAVADQHRHQQADHHAQRRQAHGVGDIDPADIHPALGDVSQQDLIEEDIAKAHRQKHVRGDQAEGHHAGDQATVQLQLGQYIQQRRYQQRNKRNVDRQDVLRGNRHHPQQADQQPFDVVATAGVLAVHQQQGFVRQRMGQAGLGNRHGESTEQCVGQGHGCAAAQPAVEGLERGFDTQATGQAAHQGADDNGDDHVHAGQAEYQHGADRGDDCVNHGYLKQKQKRQACPRAAHGNSCRRAGLKEVLLEGAHFAGAGLPCQKLW